MLYFVTKCNKKTLIRNKKMCLNIQEQLIARYKNNEQYKKLKNHNINQYKINILYKLNLKKMSILVPIISLKGYSKMDYTNIRS